MKTINDWVISECEAVADGDCAYQYALFIRNAKDEFHDGDGVLFGYTIDEIDSEETLTDILRNDFHAFTMYHEVLESVRNVH